MNNKVKILLPILIFLGIISAIFLLISEYYSKVLPINTWINDTYCTGMRLQEVNAILVETNTPETIEITFPNESEPVIIDAKQIGLKLDYLSTLNKTFRKRAFFDWVGNLKKAKYYTFTDANISFDLYKLADVFANISYVKESYNHTETISLYYDGDHYVLEERDMSFFDPDKAFAELQNQLNVGCTQIDLTSDKLYTDRPYSEQEKDSISLYDKIKSLYKAYNIVYDMGAEQINLDYYLDAFISKDEFDMPVLDSTGNLIMNRISITEFVEQLCDTYNTKDIISTFQSTRGDTVCITYKTYGTELDYNKELEYLLTVFENNLQYDDVHTPVYTKEAYARGINDIGKTYVEIDLTTQKLYYYKDGDLFVETDVVTGNISQKHDTPEGVYYIYDMARNVTLKGQGYSSFVKYWVPVYKGIGIHDASWRSEFGGEIYLKNGSHGCVNIPSEIMPDLYDNFEIGIPVVIFY